MLHTSIYFYQAFHFIVEALDIISSGHNTEDYSDLYSDWDISSRNESTDSQQHDSIWLHYRVSYNVSLSFAFSGITEQLQSTTLGIIEAHSMINSNKAVYKEERQTVDIDFKLSMTMLFKWPKGICCPCYATTSKKAETPQQCSCWVSGCQLKKECCCSFSQSQYCEFCWAFLNACCNSIISPWPCPFLDSYQGAIKCCCN